LHIWLRLICQRHARIKTTSSEKSKRNICGLRRPSTSRLQNISYPEYKSFTVSFHVDFSSADNVFKDVQGKNDQIEKIIKTITNHTPVIPNTLQSQIPTLTTKFSIDEQDLNRQEESKPRRFPRLRNSLSTEALQTIALKDIINLQTLHPTLSSHISLYFYDLVSKKDLNEKMKLNKNDEYFSVHSTPTGTLTDNPKSLCRDGENDASP